MKSSTDYQLGSALAILLVGNPKSGKSCVAAAFPAPYFLEVDNNLDSVARVMQGKPYFYDLPTLAVKTPGEVWKECLKNVKDAMVNPDIKTIVIDGLTTLSEYMCAWCIAEHIRMGDTDSKGKPIQAMTIPDYGKLLTMFRGLIFDLRSTGKHVICTVHKTTYQDDDTKVTHNILALPGQAKETLGGVFTDVIGVVAQDVPGGVGTKYSLRTVPLVAFPPLGTSIRTLPKDIDITNKKPQEIWAILEPLLRAKV